MEVSKISVRKSTWIQSATCAKRLKAKFEGVRVRSLTRHKIEGVYAQLLQDGLKPSTVTTTHKKLSQILHRYNLGSLIRNVTLPRTEVKQAIEVFTSEEIKAILENSNMCMRIFFLLAATTGMRCGEIAALTWNDISADNRFVTVSKTYIFTTKTIGPPKTRNSYRTIELPDFAIRELTTYRAIMQGFSPLVVPTQKGNYHPHANIQQRLAESCRRAKVPYRNFHVFRHTHASQLIRAGVSLTDIARRLGDTVATLISTYSHWIQPDSNTAKVVDSIFESATFAPPSLETSSDTRRHPKSKKPGK